MSFDYLVGYIMSILCRQKFNIVFHLVHEGHFHFFRIWSSVKPRPTKNVISQSLGLDLANINVYAKFIKIFHSVQEIGLFSLFSEFEPRQSLGQSQMTFNNLLGYVLSISLRMQNFIKIFQTL